MTPFTTIGEVSIDSRTSVWKIQATRSFFTLPVLICLAGWKRC